jgi:hypothetical protein
VVCREDNEWMSLRVVTLQLSPAQLGLSPAQPEQLRPHVHRDTQRQHPADILVRCAAM